MTQARVRLYEAMFVIKASLSDDARKKALDKIVSDIEGFGGEVKKIHEQGRKRLAYQIQDQRDGYYFVLYFNLPTAAVSELQMECRLNEDLIRYITLEAKEVVEKIEFAPLVQQ